MAGYYSEFCNLDAKATPYGGAREGITINEHDGAKNKIYKFTDGKEVKAPRSIINNNCAIDYRTIMNGFNIPVAADETPAYTLYSDYKRCIEANNILRQYFEDVKNPTVQNILKWYSSEEFDPYGLATYKVQDFIYNKYFSQIPNNYLITLRRYTTPCGDRMFGLDFNAAMSNALNGLPDDAFCVATATTYLGEKAGNQISSICKFSYGQKWEDKTAEVNKLQNPSGGLAAQLMGKHGVTEESMAGNGGSTWGSSLLFSSAVQAKGSNINDAHASRKAYDGDAMEQLFPDKVYGPLNRVDTVTVRQAGLTFSNEFSLVFEYDLKSLQMVNPKVAMLDIISNFLLLTGNYGSFWGGMTRYYGAQRNIAPAFGNPDLLRQARYGEYMSSVWADVKTGYETLSKNSKGEESLWTAVKKIVTGGFENMLGNLLGSKLGPASQTQIPKALLSGTDSGYWHVTIGNPLNPFLVMGNMCVESTEVEFGDTFGPDDFPTSVKFTVNLKHGRGRDISDIQSMMNAGKGRIYQFTTSGSAVLNGLVNNQEANKDSFRVVGKASGGSSKREKNSGIKTVTYKVGKEMSDVGATTAGNWVKACALNLGN